MRATAFHRRKLWVLSSVVGLLVAGVAVIGSAQDSAQANEEARRPLVIVHGLLGTKPGEVLPPMWPKFEARMKAAGWSDENVILFEYDWKQPNKKTAEQLAAKIEEVRPKTGNPEVDKVDIVSHSMGSQNSRYYIKFLGGADKVKHWVSLAGVNHGTTVRCSFWKSCEDLRTDSEIVRELNTGDETPGDVKYQTQTSSCDTQVLPHSSVALEGADNRNMGCLSHTYMPTYQKVFETTRDFLLS